MESKIKIYKIRVLIAVTVITALTGLLITFYNYRLTSDAIEAETEFALDIFTGRIQTEIEHLEVILETTVQIMNDEHIAIAKAIDFILKDATEAELSSESLQSLAGPLDILELNIVNNDGILTHSNVPSLIGFNYNDYEETRVYIALAAGALTEIREEPRQSVLDGEEYGETNHYAGVARTGGGFIQVGFDAGIIWKLYEEFDTAQAMREIDLGVNSVGIVLTDGIITTHTDSAMVGRDVTNEPWYDSVTTGYGYTWLEIDGVSYYGRYINEKKHTIIGLIPEADFYKESRDLLSRSIVLVIIAVLVIIPITYMLTTGLTREKEKAK